VSTPAAAVGLGCAAGVLLAASAWLAGALPSGDPGPGLRTGGFGAVPATFNLGLACWLLGTIGWVIAWWRYAALIRPDQRKPAVCGAAPKRPPLFGGPQRKRRSQAPASPSSTPGRLLAVGALWAAPLLFAPLLGSRDLYAYSCQGWLWRSGLDPYALGVADGGCPWTSSVPEVWWHTPTPYGPLAVALAGAAATIGVWLHTQLAALIGLRLVALAGVVLLAVALPRLARACAVAPAAAYGLGLVTPLVAVHALNGAHNDALVAGLLVAALALATTRRTGAAVVVAGGLLAAAVAVKVTALVALPFLLLLAGRRWWAALTAAVATFAGLSLVTGLGLGWLDALRRTGELVQWSSVPTAVGMSAGYLLRVAGRPEWFGAAVTAGRALGLVALAVIAVIALRTAWRGRSTPGTVVLACGWLLAATALLGPVFFPWYALAPLAVLAAAEQAEHRRRWLALATVVCAFLTLPNGLGLPVLTKTVGAFVVTAALIVALVRRARSTATA
jgi:hypothetical protein